MKLIKTWKELSKLKNDKYRVIVDLKYCSGWIVPLHDKKSKWSDFDCRCSNDIKNSDEFFEHHVYLSTHTFYGSQYKYSTKVLQEHGFDVEIDNWDKEEKKNGN